MKKVIMPALLAVFLVWLMFFSNREKPAQMQTLAMGTLVDMTVLGLGGQTNYQVLQNAMLQLRELETIWHPDRIKPEGQALLAELNRRLQQGETLTVPQPLQQGFADAASYTGTSNGLFDPAIGGLVKLWGFHSDEQFPSAPPAAADIQQALATPHFDDLLQNQALTGRADMRLDFGAFAKGLILQEVADAIVAEYPQASLLLNGGGDLVAVGQRPSRPWRIAVRHPREQGRYLATIALKDGEAAFTSGDYERFFDSVDAQGQAQHFHHILDPRSGWPAKGSQSLTVLHADGGLADAASTALFVAGDDWPSVAASMGITAVLRVTANGQIEWTPEMAKRAELSPNSNGVKPQAVVRAFP